jgi:4-hydroxybenzoate polyprenyltransferase
MLNLPPALSAVVRRLSSWTRVIRAHDWWTYKVAMILSTAYATAAHLGVSPAAQWPTLLLLVVALVLVAMFASLINDLCDLEEDRLGGKSNQLEGLSGSRVVALFVACVIPGLVIGASLRHSITLLAIYAANWLIFALYSVPPFRWKNRALLGILAIALGESALPHVFAVLLVSAGADRAAGPVWTALVAVWAFAVGARSILWHQLRDHQADRDAGVRTFVVRATPRRVIWLGRLVVFPLELAALLGMLWEMGIGMAWVMLAIYAVTDLLRHWLWKIPVVVLDPAPNDRLLLFEYYDMLYPLGCIASAIPRDGTNLALLAIVATATPRCGWWMSDLWFLSRQVVASLARRVRPAPSHSGEPDSQLSSRSIEDS